MPDISMCKSESCTLKDSCYRYKATPNPYAQSYGDFSQDENKKCDDYLEIDKEE